MNIGVCTEMGLYMHMKDPISKGNKTPAVSPNKEAGSVGGAVD